ncbi:hypothetical protein AGMMS50293_29690 [Spirochaetia bacterium]|nr:hypothetical protein AGMMS50293_29690 [Spirochaetia bacterium]
MLNVTNKHRCLLLCFWNALVLASCPIITFEYLDTACSVGKSQDYFAEDYITITFSQQPDIHDTESKLRFYENNGVVRIDTVWEGATVRLRPHVLWQKGQTYSLDLQGLLKMEDGRTYTVSLYRDFIYGESGNDFTLSSWEFKNNILSFVFSHPVSITSFEEKFAFTPFADYKTTFSDNNTTVAIDAHNGWAINTTYSWSIKEMVNAAGYLMRKEYSGQISGLPDIVQPILETVCPVDYSGTNPVWFINLQLHNNLLENQAIGFIFSKPMDESSVRSGISFYPSISGYFAKETEMRFMFIPEEPLQLQKEYRLTITDSIKDTSGLSLYKPQHIYFTTALQYLEVMQITFDTNINPTPMPFDGSVADFTMPTSDLVPLETTIDFSTVIPQDKRNTAVNTISLTTLFPASAKIPSLISAHWSSGGSRLSLTWNNFSISSAGIENYYILKIGGGTTGVTNQASEYLKEDVCVIFITR